MVVAADPCRTAGARRQTVAFKEDHQQERQRADRPAAGWRSAAATPRLRPAPEPVVPRRPASTATARRPARHAAERGEYHADRHQRGARVAFSASGVRGAPRKVTPYTFAIHITASAPVIAVPTASSGPSRRPIKASLVLSLKKDW